MVVLLAVPLATKLISEFGDVLDAATFHFYGFNSYELSIGHAGISNSTLTNGNLSHLWSPASLDVIAGSVSVFREVLKNASHPELPVWLSETNSICSGGVSGLTNAYANTIWLLNQLGQLVRTYAMASGGAPQLDPRMSLTDCLCLGFRAKPAYQ